LQPIHNQAVKRVLDVGISAAFVLIAGPFLAAIALLSLIVQGPPVFFVSRRFVGVDRDVKIYKFRTMVRDATSVKYDLKGRYMRQGFLDIPTDCDVYTPLGRILERTEIVEMPQVLNVIFDRLSWVGNRPLPQDNIEMLRAFQGWEERFDSPCGLTGISQVIGKHKLVPADRIAIERLYARVYKRGNVLKADLMIVLATLKLVLIGQEMEFDRAVEMLESCLPSEEVNA